MVYLNRHVNCVDPKCNLKPDPLNNRILPKTLEAVRNFKCAKCFITCSICGTKDVGAFSKSYIKHKVDLPYNIRCNECCHPACTNPDCSTCKSCRDIKCNRFSCAKTPIPMHKKWRPKTLEEVQNFKCARCKEQTFDDYNCIGCDKMKDAKAFETEAITVHRKNPDRRKILCLECLEQGRTIRDTKLYFCHLCNRRLGRAKFCISELQNFQRGRLIILQCTECQLSNTMST